LEGITVILNYFFKIKKTSELEKEILTKP